MDLLEFEASLFYSASFKAAWATQRNPGRWENRKTGQEMPLPPPPHIHTTPQLPRLRHTFGTPSPRDSNGVREARTHGPANPASARAPWARRQVSPGQRARARPSAEPEKRQAARAAGHLFLAQASFTKLRPGPAPTEVPVSLLAI